MTNEKKISKKGVPLKVVSKLFNYGWMVNNIGFFLFLSFLAVVYIANGHMADNRIRKINDTGRKLKDLKYEYKMLKSEMMFKSRESEVVKAAEPLGLSMDSVSPVKIKLLKTGL